MAASAPTRPTSSLGRSPLKTYITIAAVAVIPLAAFLFLAHNLLKRDSVARVTAQSSQAAKVYGTLVDQHFTETSVFLQSFAVRREVLRDWQAKRFDAISADLKQLHALRPDFQGFGMFDVDGAFRAGDRAPQSSSQNFASRDWYQGVRREWKPYVSSVFPAANDGALEVAVAVPVFDQDHRPVGILVGGQSLAMVTKQLYGVLNAQNASLILVVDQKGQVFGKPTADAGVTLLPANPALSEALADRSKPSAGRITTVAATMAERTAPSEARTTATPVTTRCGPARRSRSMAAASASSRGLP